MTDEWPRGVERRRPRVAQNPDLGILLGGALLGGTMMGALVGAMASSKRDQAEGAVVGAAAGLAAGGMLGALGGANANQAMSLEQSLRIALEQMKSSFVSLRYYGRYEARLVFEISGRFDVAVAKANADPTWTTEALDDWLYETLITETVRKMKKGNAP